MHRAIWTLALIVAANAASAVAGLPLLGTPESREPVGRMLVRPTAPFPASRDIWTRDASLGEPQLLPAGPPLISRPISPMPPPIAVGPDLPLDPEAATALELLMAEAILADQAQAADASVRTVAAVETATSGAPPAPMPDERLWVKDDGVGVAQARCLECSGAPALGPITGGGGECLTCGLGCVPGQPLCTPCSGRTRLGRFCCGLYQAICCPDPCYEPKWRPLANAAFHVAGARPVTQNIVRWDAGIDTLLPDRSGYLWAATGSLGPSNAERLLTYHDLSLYTEAGTGSFAAIVDMRYRSNYPAENPHTAGMADMRVGTKSLLFDSELLMISYQFLTFIPTGSTSKGLGIGDVAMEHSLLFGLNLSPRTFLQAQISEWFPIAAPASSGAILHYHLSWNRQIAEPVANVPLIGTLELNGWSFQAGEYTAPDGATHTSGGTTYLSVSPGLRLVICDKVDFGVGSDLALTDPRFSKMLLRSEFRWRY